MPTVDHSKLDAYASARLEIKRTLDSFQRRIYDESKTAIDTEIQRCLATGESYEGHEIGKSETLRVIAGYVGEPLPAIEAAASERN